MFLILLTQPIVTGIILAFVFSFDPIFVFITALLTQLIYFKNTPSGVSLFPEYSMSFFIVTGSMAYVMKLDKIQNEDHIINHLLSSNLILYIVISLILIIVFSYLVTRFYSIKNRLLENKIANFLDILGVEANKSFYKISIYSTFLTMLVAVISSSIIFLLIHLLSFILNL